ncbi:TetR/AcrR family transcriptional regulator [Curvivirga sp.]|uniref:TetR/AcrR family transcriptional regulator n=1 Tax=Curvivirga sp. TaxID=2856848 RepID=UPI003B5B302E
MMKTQTKIIEAADQLFYEHGFEATSFAHIAEVVNISRGNFYYHFKTKDEILDAVILARLTRTESMLDQWEIDADSAADRIKSFIKILIVNQTKIMKFGCPVGTLSAELIKLDHDAQDGANKLFTLFRVWLQRQFETLGHKENADQLSMHLLGRSQGVASLANAFKDESYVQSEVDQMCDWVDHLTLKQIH